MKNKKVELNASRIYELIPRNGRKSFYGKANVIVAEGWELLKCYDTIMCAFDDKGVLHKYSNITKYPTCCHLKSFLGESYYAILKKMDCEEAPTIHITL